MAAPRYLVKADQAGEMLIVTDESRVRRSGGESFQYSDEKKAADAAIEKALKRLKGDDAPPLRPDRKDFTDQPAYNAAWDQWNKDLHDWRVRLGNALVKKHMDKAIKAFEKRQAALPITRIRVDVGDNIPGLSGNQSKRVKRLTPLDARRLDALERRIVALQAERAAHIWEAYGRADTLTPAEIVAIADVPQPKRSRMEPHRGHTLDGIHSITAHSAGRRKAVA